MNVCVCVCVRTVNTTLNINIPKQNSNNIPLLWFSNLGFLLHSLKLTKHLPGSNPKRKGLSSNHQFSGASCWFQGGYPSKQNGHFSIFLRP